MAATVKTPEDLKRETADLVRRERETRLDQKARGARDGVILDAYDRLAAGRPTASESAPPKRHSPVEGGAMMDRSDSALARAEREIIGYERAVDEIIAYFQDMQRKANKAGNGHMDWPAAAAMHVEVVFKRKL